MLVLLSILTLLIIFVLFIIYTEPSKPTVNNNAGCSTNLNCPPGYVCISKTCTPSNNTGCSTNSDCATGYVCSNGSCASSNNTGCSTNSDCPPDYICSGGSCMLSVTTLAAITLAQNAASNLIERMQEIPAYEIVLPEGETPNSDLISASYAFTSGVLKFYAQATAYSTQIYSITAESESSDIITAATVGTNLHLYASAFINSINPYVDALTELMNSVHGSYQIGLENIIESLNGINENFWKYVGNVTNTAQSILQIFNNY